MAALIAVLIWALIIAGLIYYLRYRKRRNAQWKAQAAVVSQTVECATCHSVGSVRKISESKKALAGGLGGVLGNPIRGKTFECNNCGYRW